jgi:hypothetical protein
VEALEDRTLPSTINWINPNGGDWGLAANWDLNRVPTVGDDVGINVAVTNPITFSLAADTIHSLSSDDPFTLAGGSLTVAGTVQVNNTFFINGGNLIGATVLAGTGGQGVFFGTAFNNAQNRLDGVTMNANMDLTGGSLIAPGASAVANIVNGLTLNGTAALADGNHGGQLVFTGTQALAGAATIAFAGSASLYVDGTATLTLGSGVTVHGVGSIGHGRFTGGTDTLVNQGLISADVGNSNLSLASTIFTNGGTVEAKNGGFMGISATAWNSSGILRATGTGANRSTLFLGGAGTLLPGNTFTMAGGGEIQVLGSLDNSGQTQTLDTSAGVFLLNGGTLKGGTFTGPAGSEIAVGPASANSQNKFDGVTLNLNLDLTGGTLIAPGTTIVGNVVNGLALNGTASLGDGNHSGQLVFTGTQTLGGAATVALNFGLGSIFVDGTSTLTLGSGVTVHGAGNIVHGRFAAGTDTLVNQGLISCDSDTRTLAIGSTNFANAGTVEAANGGTLNLSATTWSSSGTLRATGTDSGGVRSTLNLGGSGTLLPGNAFTLAVGGELQVLSLLDNTGQTQTLDTSAGVFFLNGGSLKGGTFTGPAGSEIAVGTSSISSQNKLDGVTLNLNLDLTGGTLIAPGTAALANVVNGLTLNGTASLGDGNHGGQLVFTGTQTLAGAATITFVGSASLYVDGTATLTLGPGATVHGVGSIGHGRFTGGTDTLVNQGLISADVGSSNMLIASTNFTNAGTVEAKNGGTLTDQAAPTNFATGTLTGGTWRVFGNSTIQAPFGAAGIATNAAGIVLDGANSNFTNSSNAASALANFLTNAAAGSFTIQNGRNFTAAGSFSNAGAVTFGSGSTLTVPTQYQQTGGSTTVNGTLAVSGPGTANIQAGTLMGAGTITGNVTNAGQVSPGNSPGSLTITGNYTQSSGGTLNVEIGGTGAGQFDRLQVSGTATLDGTLKITTLNGFSPSPGNSFQVLTFAARSGDFATVNGIDLGGGNYFARLFSAGDMTLVVNGAPHLSINDVSVSEGNSGVTAATFTIALSATPLTVSVGYATADGSATTADNDYVSQSGTLTFAPGETSKTITIQVNGDTKFEPDETFSVNLSGPTNATIASGMGTNTIQNDDPQPSLAVGNVAAPEGNSGTTGFTFTVSLSNASSQAVTVNYATADGTATTTDNDYVATSGTLTFAPGDLTKTLTVLVNGDTKVEPDETFSVNLGSPTNAMIAVGTGTGTIQNDDSQPALTIGDVAAPEGNSGTASFGFTVSLSNPSSQAVTVTYGTADGTATTADNDYQAASGTVTFAPGETSKIITIQVNGDAKFEPDETFSVNLSGASNATIAAGTGTGTIQNDDSQPTLSIGNLAAPEGNSGTTPFAFTVSLSNSSYQTITVNYATEDGTATTADNDYVAASGSLSFAPGETSKTITIQVNGDTKFEPDETFTVNLSGPTNATVAAGTGTGTIQNDDPQPALSIDSPSAAEGNSGTTPFSFTVSLSNASYQAVTVNYGTADGTATTADNDYVAGSGSLSFAPGEMSKTITIQVNGDTTFESDETFAVILSNPANATIAVGTGTGTIQNDDAQPALAIGNVAAPEGNGGTTSFAFTVSLSNPSYQAITVNYATADGTATMADNDYVANNGTLTFASGETSKTIIVLVNGDTKFEPNETFAVNLSSPNNATIAAGTGTGTIQNDDPQPALSIGNVTASEGNSGTTPFTFTVSLTNPSSQAITVNYATADGTATTADNDYQAASGTLIIPAGSLSGSLTVLVNGDTTDEPDETFNVVLSNPANATIATSTGTGTIQNDDQPPQLSINNVSLAEGNSGTTAFTFSVSLSAASGRTVTVNYATADGTSTTADNDYQAAGGSLTFASGDVTKKIIVLVNGDTKVEPDETFSVNLSGAANASISSGTGTGTILNDDAQAAVLLSINNVTQPEGNNGTTPFAFTVSLSSASTSTVTVNYATADGTATAADTDYVATNGSLTFAPGETSKSVTVLVNGDTKFEPDETFSVNLGSPTNASITAGTGTGTIQNDDPRPALSIGNVTAPEGNSGTTPCTFIVSLSNPSYQTIAVNYDTADGTATSADNDYQAASGTLTFAPGETSKTVTVLINGDTKFEADEGFSVNLSSPTNATLAAGSGVGTIQNDDPQPALALGNVSAPEGNRGTTPFVFTVSLSNPSDQSITVDFATADGTATTADNDYVTTSGTLTFAPGETTKTVTVLVNGDATFEPDESFSVALTNPTQAVIAGGTGTGTIQNDDPQPALAIDNFSAPEGNSGTTPFTFTVSLSNPSSQTITVNYATADGTATTADNDYQSASGTLTFAPGELTKTITVLVIGDTKVEPDENFSVNLSGAANATIAASTSTGTILNDDSSGTVSLSINDVTQAEGNSGTTPFVFIVTLSAPATSTVTVKYATADSTATSHGRNADFAAAKGKLTFNRGETAKTITVLVHGDTMVEPDEIFFVNLGGAVNASIGRGRGTGTILNDDFRPQVSISDVKLFEGNSGTTPFVFTVTLSAPSAEAVTVKYSTADGTATSHGRDADYTALRGTLTFNPGETTQMITVLVNGDTRVEPDETFFINLSRTSGATIVDGQGVGSILNDDNAGPSPHSRPFDSRIPGLFPLAMGLVTDPAPSSLPEMNGRLLVPASPPRDAQAESRSPREKAPRPVTLLVQQEPFALWRTEWVGRIAEIHQTAALVELADVLSRRQEMGTGRG